MATLAEALRAYSDRLINLPTEVQKFIVGPTSFLDAVTGKTALPSQKGFAEGATGAPMQQNLTVLDPNNRSYMEGYETGEPFGYAAMASPFAAAGATKLSNKAVQAITKNPNATAMGVIDYASAYNPANILPPPKFRGATLKGMPDLVKVGDKLEQFGTDQRIVDIAEDYARSKGLDYKPLTTYAEVDPDRAKRLALAYQLMKNEPNNPLVKQSYAKLIDETVDQYEALRKQGYKFDFMPESGDIYGNPRNAINDIVTNKHLSVFPTEQGFGGPSAAKASEANPLLMKVGEKWGGKDVTANDLFRAVHDVFGHAKHGVGFRAAGEENAFQSHARMYSPQALPAATSETRGQNSWVNFGPYGDMNRSANPLLTEYAEQKTGLMPAWTWLEGISK
jgi:hypothetical protein